MPSSLPNVLVDMSLHPLADARLRSSAQVSPLPTGGPERVAALARADGVLAYGPPGRLELARAERLRAIAVHLAPPDVQDRLVLGDIAPQAVGAGL
ncbi:MAG: hypothetical protein HGA44_05870, partial [Cellulomonadaceae bacterium]|nr:hypothetical protein [Cellulomonadaceae bacterium]